VCGDEARSARVVAHEMRCVCVCVCADEQTSAQLSGPDACHQFHRCRRPPLLLGLPSLLFSVCLNSLVVCAAVLLVDGMRV